MIAAGTLRHRINIEQRASGADALGQPVETWDLVTTAWADVRHLGGIEALKAGADVAILRASIRIRHRIGLVAGMRVTHEGKYYNIKAVLPDGRRQYVDLICDEVW